MQDGPFLVCIENWQHEFNTCRNLGYQMREHTSPGFQGKAENIKQKKQQVTTSETAEVLHSISINKSQQI